MKSLILENTLTRLLFLEKIEESFFKTKNNNLR